VAFGVAFFVAFYYQDELQRLMTRPYRNVVDELNAKMRADWIAKHPSHETTLVDQLVDELEKAKVLPKDAADRLHEAQKQERTDEVPQLPRNMQAVSLGESFSAYMLVCTLAAVVVSAPFMLYQLWRFVSAGLYEHERRTVMRVLPWSLLLFFAGLVFGF